MCTNKVVAGVRFSAILPTICPQNTSQFTSAQQVNQFERLAVARPWGFESPLPQTNLTLDHSILRVNRSLSREGITRVRPQGTAERGASKFRNSMREGRARCHRLAFEHRRDACERSY